MTNRKVSATQELAYWFVREIFGREFDYRGDGQHLRNAKMLLSPSDSGGEAFTIEEIQKTLLSMRDGLFNDIGWPRDRPIQTMLAVLWGNPRFIDRVRSRTHVPPCPDWYYETSVRKWHEKYDKYIVKVYE